MGTIIETKTTTVNGYNLVKQDLESEKFQQGILEVWRVRKLNNPNSPKDRYIYTHIGFIWKVRPRLKILNHYITFWVAINEKNLGWRYIQQDKVANTRRDAVQLLVDMFFK